MATVNPLLSHHAVLRGHDEAVLNPNYDEYSEVRDTPAHFVRLPRYLVCTHRNFFATL